MQILMEGSSPFSPDPRPLFQERTGDKEAQLREKGLEYPEGGRAEGSSATEWQAGETLTEEQGEKKKNELGQSTRNRGGEREQRWRKRGSWKKEAGQTGQEREGGRIS